MRSPALSGRRLMSALPRPCGEAIGSRHTRQRLKKLGIVGVVVCFRSGVTRRVDSGRPVEGIDLENPWLKTGKDMRMGGPGRRLTREGVGIGASRSGGADEGGQ